MKQRLKDATLLRKDLELAPSSEAMSGGNLSTAGTIANSALATDDASSLKDQKAVTKGLRKKMMDPESIKLREQKMKENRLQRESDNYFNA